MICNHIWCNCNPFKDLSVTMNHIKVGFPKTLQENTHHNCQGKRKQLNFIKCLSHTDILQIYCMLVTYTLTTRLKIPRIFFRKTISDAMKVISYTELYYYCSLVTVHDITNRSVKCKIFPGQNSSS